MTRAEAIGLLSGLMFKGKLKEALDMAIASLKSDENYFKPDEWCDTCKEYDQKKHCCPRFNKVIRKTLAEAYEASHATWQQINKNEVNVIPRWKCSECGSEFECFDMDFEYCPNCGAKMESEDKE